MGNSRKHIRVAYEKPVELIAEQQTVTGKSIDISNSGIQIVVNIPASDLSVQKIALSLPSTSETLQIPCKIVRSSANDADEEEHVLGIEFSYQTEAQMAHIDNFIKDMKNIQLKNDLDSAEMRIIPRTACSLTGISCNRSDISILSIDNISTDGCLVSFMGMLNTHDSMEIEFSLPDDSRVISTTCTVAYVIHNYFRNVSKAGLFFGAMADIDSIKIHNFIVKSTSANAIKSIQERRFENIIGNEYQIHDPERIGGLFNLLKKESESINILLENSLNIYELVMRNIAPEEQFFATTSNEEIGSMELKKYHPTYFSFHIQGSSYYFKSELLVYNQDCLIFAFPKMLYHSEKRSHDRKYLGDGVDISIKLENSPSSQLKGKLVNISRRGFLCNVILDPSEKELLKSGAAVSYSFGKEMGLDSFGEVRHIKEESLHNGEKVLQIGVEAGISRSDFTFKKYRQTQWNKQKKGRQRASSIEKEKIISDVVRYDNRDGNEIKALLNYTRLGTEAPVVILPPAFGKKKEVLSPLAVTLIDNFNRHEKDIVIIRYDGVNRPGESYNDDMCPKRGYEMLHYRISQGMDDLEATVDFVCNNDLFKPSQVIIVAFSMSALDARKLAQRDRRISYLINVMGVTCARSSFRNIMGGLDIISNYRMGIKNGLSGVLGQILDLDAASKDLIDNKYAYMADARHDMSQIDIPVSWIYGKYDKWISEREIRDMMSVRAAGDREVIEIPTGHNLRSSEDAIMTFKIITGLIFRRLYGKKIRPSGPDRDTMVNLITYERERLNQVDEVNKNEYWKEYLLGKNGSAVGYDFYKNYEEFNQFLSMQGSLIDLQNGEVMADMGCGTGIFIERMLEDMASKGTDLSRAALVQVDLVHEALARTKEKIERLATAYGSLMPGMVEYVQMDLEPNRLLPVKRFLDDRTLGIDYLRNRIEGLKNITIDRMAKSNSKNLADILRGSPLTDDTRAFLKVHFSDEDYDAIIDLNRAARFLTGNLTYEDLSRVSVLNGSTLQPDYYKNLRASDVNFQGLNFGNSGLNLGLNFNDGSFDKIAASLLISYLFNPDEIIHEFYRVLKPGGRLLVSSMLPDGDFSMIFTNYINKVQNLEVNNVDVNTREQTLKGAREMLNETASLFELEADGFFKFFNGDEIESLLNQTGFTDIHVESSIGKPPLAVIATGIKPFGEQ
jgi:ubiquinone/menaquinone biosynthesis C-methylase UbiE/c-di-GMP-binding flagellar brake protein YcgR/pimeloyl-ACP methyl ester carboxylesterase